MPFSTILALSISLLQRSSDGGGRYIATLSHGQAVALDLGY
jgi:hypothetical protein